MTAGDEGSRREHDHPSRHARARRPTRDGRDRGHRASSSTIDLVARRQVLKRLRQYVMVVLLIALPVAGASGASVLIASSMPTTAQEISSTLGETAARVQWTGYDTRQSVRGVDQSSGDAVDYRPPADVVPGVDRTLTLRTLWTRVGTSPTDVVIGPVTDPVFTGRYVLERGRAAERGDEVLVTPALADDDGLVPGSTTTVHRVPGAAGDGPRDVEVTVVGVLSQVGAGSTDRQVFARDDLAPWPPDPSELPSLSPSLAPSLSPWLSIDQYLVGDSVDWAEVSELGRAGFVVWSATVVADPPPDGTPRLQSESGYGTTSAFAALAVVFAVFVGAEVALLAGAAFGVGARRQRRTLAVLAAVGADQRALTRVVTRQGVWVGVVAAVTGLAVGVDLGIAVVLLARHAGVDVGPFSFWGVHVPGVVVTGIGVFAVVVSWIAAVVPARRAARVDVMASLRGGHSNHTSRESRRRARRQVVLAGALIAGGVLACLGAGWVSYTTSVTVGSRWWWAAFVGLAVAAVSALVGVLVLVPVLVRRLGRWSALAPVPVRLALRDASHGVARTAPAVAAVTTAVFVAVFGVSLSSASARASSGSYYQPYPAGTVAVAYDSASDLRLPGGSAEAAAIDSAATTAVERRLPVSSRAVWQTPVPRGYDSSGAVVAVDAVTPWAVLTVPERCDSSTGRLEGLSTREVQRITGADPTCTFPLSAFTSYDNIIVTDADGLAVTLGAEPSPEARAAFDSGGVIAFDRSLVVDGEATIGIATAAEADAGLAGSSTPPRPIILPNGHG